MLMIIPRSGETWQGEGQEIWVQEILSWAMSPHSTEDIGIQFWFFGREMDTDFRPWRWRCSDVWEGLSGTGVPRAGVSQPLEMWSSIPEPPCSPCALQTPSHPHSFPGSRKKRELRALSWDQGSSIPSVVHPQSCWACRVGAEAPQLRGLQRESRDCTFACGRGGE